MSAYWWILPIVVSLIFYKQLFRIFGIVLIPENKIGLVTKKFVLFGADRSLPDGRIIALKGEAGYQAKTLAPGVYYGLWPWQYSITQANFIQIPPGKIGLINARDGAQLTDGRILGKKVECDNFQDSESFITNGGQKGRQSSYITSGLYRINANLFDVSVVDQIQVPDNRVGIVTTLDGNPLDATQIAGKQIADHDKFQNYDKFIDNGGQKGLQQEVILAGTYNINPWAVQVEIVEMTSIQIGYVGVVISYVGEDGIDTSGEGFKHGNIVSKGYRGVWAEPLGPGRYPINTYCMKVELVPTTNLVLNWATARNESHMLDKNLSTITVRSKDGFPFNLDVSQIIHIPMNEAPKVIARFGNMQNLVSQVLEPTIGNYFRNSAQDSDVISFLSTRKERQGSAKDHISSVLEEYNVHAVDTLIGDITPPAELMKTLTDRKLASEQKITYKTQKEAQEDRQQFEKQKSIADIQHDVVQAEQGVLIAEKKADAVIKSTTGEATSIELKAKATANATKLNASAEAERITVTGNAEAGKILAIGKSTAESYHLAVDAMGEENFTKLKVTQSIGEGGIKVMPDILISGSGGGGSSLDGLVGMELLNYVNNKKIHELKESPESKVEIKEVKEAK